ncbi:MAG: FtsX-like permease family protein [Pseudomonadales bacterium]
MSEAVACLPVSQEKQSLLSMLVRVGRRNLARNRRRTWLTSGGIAFAVLLVVFFQAMQLGVYGEMMENSTSLLSGHIQIESAKHLDRGRFEDTLEDATTLQRTIAATRGVVSVAPRVEAFALASAGERSFGARIVGVDVSAERATVRFLKTIIQGREMLGSDEAIIGSVLARNLGVAIGGELVLLGAGKEGGVAAMVVNLVGIFESGIVDLDRGMLWVPIATVQNAFGLGDEVHRFAIRTDELGASEEVVRDLRARLENDAEVRVRHWGDVMPEIRQAIEIDKLASEIFYYIIEVLVLFSVVNSFIMTVFERTREFGMLLAIGMRPWSIIAMVQWEAFFVWLLGAGAGIGVAALLVFWLQSVGIYMGDALEEMADQLYVSSRLYPAFSAEAFLSAPLIMLAGTQLAALLPSLRIRRLRPVEALRAE